MCTLIAFHRVWDGVPLVVATNRDEHYERPASGPRWFSGPPRVLAPVDERAGGTWMGFNDTGLWVGLTNRDAAPYVTGRTSRGLLCRQLLQCTDLGACLSLLEAAPEPYNGFNLLIANGATCCLAEYEEGSVRVHRLLPGVHVVTNRDAAGMAEEPKVRRALERLTRIGIDASAPGPEPADLTARLFEVLADHGRAGDDALCLHGDGYGTRSAAVWRCAETSTGALGVELTYADGAPCNTPPERVPDWSVIR